MAYRILRTARARQDLEEIARYTLDRWGRRQMVKYLRRLDTTIQTLANDPQRCGQDRSQLREGLRSVSHERYHFIFYRVRANAVEILRILHQRRDWINMLNP